MSFWHLTLEKKNELLRKKDEKCTELDILKKKSPADLWTEDLDALSSKVCINLHKVKLGLYVCIIKLKQTVQTCLKYPLNYYYRSE